jgi:hypothetical protein
VEEFTPPHLIFCLRVKMTAGSVVIKPANHARQKDANELGEERISFRCRNVIGKIGSEEFLGEVRLTSVRPEAMVTVG